MSFYQSETGRGYAPGYILAEAECGRKTATITADNAQAITLANGAKIVPMGSVIPANDANAVGILYEDVEVTNGDAPGSVVTRGTIYADRLPATVADTAKAALTEITFKDEPDVTRPDDTTTSEATAETAQ